MSHLIVVVAQNKEYSDVEASPASWRRVDRQSPQTRRRGYRHRLTHRRNLAGVLLRLSRLALARLVALRLVGLDLPAGAPFSAPPFAALPGAAGVVVVVLAAFLDEALNAVAPLAPPTSIAPRPRRQPRGFGWCALVLPPCWLGVP